MPQPPSWLDGSTLAPAQRAVAPRRLEARLAVVYPPELVQSISIDEPRLVLGRSSHVTGGLPHVTVSRQHFSIVWDDERGRHVGADLGSKNGSWIDGVPAGAERHALRDGAVIRVGDVIMIFELLEDTADAAVVSRDEVPGDAVATRCLRAKLAAAAPDPSPVLLLGETGTGKERLAAEIHRLSGRRGPFVAVNCAELGSELIESQLFGHARGAFTGAHQGRPGLFRSADGGTILLDEIGELPLAMQPKLLRVLQEQKVLPVGDEQPIAIDVRVIAATNSDLPRQVDAGGFRRDLYARLALWEIRVPPLRARKADVLAWIDRLHRRWASVRGGTAAPPLCFEARAAEALVLAGWPDNLRGLDRLVHRLASSPEAAEPIVRAAVEDLIAPVTTATPPTGPMREPTPRRPAPGPDELRAALDEHKGSIRAVAKFYGRDRRQIYRWMKQYGLR